MQYLSKTSGFLKIYDVISRVILLYFLLYFLLATYQANGQ